MKKLFLIFALVLCFACGQDTEAQQSGLGGSNMIPVHGHNASTDGGTLNAPSLYAYAAQTVVSITCASLTKIPFNTKLYDTNNWYDNITNYRYTPLQSGKYFITASFSGSGVTNTSHEIRIYKNGTAINGAVTFDSTSNASTSITGIVNMNGITDYLEIFGIVNAASGCNFIGTAASVNYTYLSIIRIAD